MMNFFKFLFIGCWLFVNTATASVVAIQKEDAHTWASTKGEEIINILSESDIRTKYTKLDKMMNEDVNLDYISKFVIGKYGRLMDKEQKAQYNNLFHRYVLSLYKKFHFKMNTESLNFSIDEVIEHPRFTTVSCSVDLGEVYEDTSDLQEGNKIPVKFKLIRGENNRIQAVDVEISNVSMVLEYRKKFYQMIKEEDEDINWFLERFNDTVTANEKDTFINAGI